MSDLKEFRKALQVVFPCSSKKASIPSLSCFAFQNGRVMCSDGKVVCSVPLETGISGLIEAESLLTWLKAVPKSANEFETRTDKPSIVFESGKSSIRMGLLRLEEFPEYRVPQSDEEGVPVEAAQSLDALKLAKGCAGQDFSLTMSGLFLEWDGESTVYFRATDKVAAIETRLAVEKSCDVPQAQVCIPAEAIDVLLKAGGILEIVFTDDDSGMVWFRTPKALIGSRVREAPELSSLVDILARCGSGDMVQVSEDLCEAFDTVCPVAVTGDLNKMEATIWNGEIEFSASTDKVVEAKATAPVEHGDLDVAKRLAFSASSLNALLDYADEIHFPDDPLGHIQVRSESVCGVMALIRL